MKNLIFKSFCLALAAGSTLTMQSCKQTVDPNPQDGQQLGFTTAIVVPGAAASKAGSEVSRTAFVSGDQIGLWVVPFSTTGDGVGVADVRTDLRPIGNYSDNIVYTHNGTSITSITPIFYPTSQTKVDLYAVSPYNATMSDKTSNSMTSPKAFTFAIEQNQNVVGGSAVIKSDFMTALYSGAKQGADGSLSFHHRLSRVTVKFSLKSLYSGLIIKSIKSVELCNVPLKSNINITDTTARPVVPVLDNAKVNVAAYSAIIPDSGIAGDYVYEAIITPGTSYVAGDALVKVVLEIQSLGDVEFLCKTKDALTIAAKRQTNITVNITDQTTISFTTVDINGWGTPVEYNPTTTKLANMFISCVAEAGQAIVTSAVKAKVTIQGEVFEGIVKYDNATSQYRIQYDHKKNFGGLLTAIELIDASGKTVIAATTSPVTGLRIKGDPTSDTYAEVIGTLTFKTNGTVELK